MKKAITTVLFGLAFSIGAWIVSALNGPATPDISSVVKQQVVVSQSPDSPFEPSRPSPGADVANKLLDEKAPPAPPIHWTGIVGIGLIAGCVIFAIKTMAAKAAKSFEIAPDMSMRARSLDMSDIA